MATAGRAFSPGAMRVALALSGAAWLVGCAPSSYVLVGTARPPIAPSAVVVYSHPPAVFEEVAILDASSKSVASAGSQRTTDKVVDRLKAEAAKLGANGLILEGFNQTQTASIGSGVGSDSYSGHAAVGVGVTGSLGIFKTTGKGQAIFVPPT